MCLKTHRNHQKFIVLFQVLKHELNPRKELGNENTRLFFKQFKEKSILENIEIFHTLMTLRKLPFGLNYFHITIFCPINIGMQITKENILSINLVMI